MNRGYVIDPDIPEDVHPAKLLEGDLLNGDDVELILSGHRIILRAYDVGYVTGYILEG